MPALKVRCLSSFKLEVQTRENLRAMKELGNPKLTGGVTTQ
jgi:hypothetical protein